MNPKHGYIKKAAFIILASFLMVNIAQASFLDTIVALVAINPLHVSVSAPQEAELGKNFKVETIVENRGDEIMSNVKAELFISKGLVSSRKSLVKDVGRIRANGAKTISWQLKGVETGNFGISASASGEVRGDAVSAEGDTVFVAIVEKSPPGGPGPHFVQNFFSFFGSLLGKLF